MSKFPPDLIAAALASQKSSGVPACVTLAQWADESAWGTRVTGDNNYWGMKWGVGCPYPFKECPTEEEVNGKDEPEMAPFISFPSIDSALAYRAAELTDPHGPYRKALPFIRGSWRTWFHCIAHIYSTSSRYEEVITEIIIENHLDQLQ
jgi:flagellum-specific peptidoglycan hydrolase FlgJ